MAAGPDRMLAATVKGIFPIANDLKEQVMKRTGRMVSMMAATAFVLALAFSSVAFAHAGEAHGEAAGGLGWLVTYAPPLFALGGIALVGVVYFATRRRGQ